LQGLKRGELMIGLKQHRCEIAFHSLNELNDT